jgi:hypothetical protein
LQNDKGNPYNHECIVQKESPKFPVREYIIRRKVPKSESEKTGRVTDGAQAGYKKNKFSTGMFQGR